MSLALQAAQAMAALAHKDQKYGEHPYTKHLADVVGVLKRFRVTDEDILTAGWLHDIVEDTPTTLNHIEIMFGRRVSDLVHRVTNEAGVNRKARHELTYPKIKASDDAITLKLADRIANTEESISTKADILKMYQKEYPGFRKELYKPGSHDSMWRHLDFLMSHEPEPFERSGAW